MKHLTMVGICLWSLVCAQAYASIYEGKVVGVSDGDRLFGQSDNDAMDGQSGFRSM